MDITKHMDFYNPMTEFKDQIHIIGCGAIGSTLAEMLTRMGFQELHLWDFDIVTEHNLANQVFFNMNIGLNKTITTETNCTIINPEIKITCHDKGWDGQPLKGYVFLAVDNIDLRRQIATDNKYNQQIKGMFDFRMRFSDAQHYGANWHDPKAVEAFINTMQFTHEEAKAETPVSACGTSLNIITTVRIICSYGLCNFLNFIKEGKIKKMVLIDGFKFDVLAVG
jgi:molybdopterin/thiamine biosynthesis adenylyltransferase